SGNIDQVLNHADSCDRMKSVLDLLDENQSVLGQLFYFHYHANNARFARAEMELRVLHTSSVTGKQRDPAFGVYGHVAEVRHVFREDPLDCDGYLRCKLLDLRVLDGERVRCTLPELCALVRRDSTRHTKGNNISVKGISTPFHTSEAN